jgi:hypothetical protein
MMKRLIEAVIITIALAIVADPVLLTTGFSLFQVSGQQVGINSENIALGTVQIQTDK